MIACEIVHSITIFTLDRWEYNESDRNFLLNSDLTCYILNLLDKTTVIFILIIMIVMTASGIYVVENQAQPEEFSSIPKAMWWAVVTLTTVGYGDVTPVTNMGKFLGAMITILGVGIAALPAGILASGLANELNLRNQKLEQEFREALQARGVDLLHDQREIENIRLKVGLPKEQTHEIIMQLVKEKILEDQEQATQHKAKSFCPHCGEKLSE